ncbi:MAG: DUF3017 domain-containing protein [Propionibacteriaceae bacterium]
MSWLRQWPLLIIVAGILAGLVVVGNGAWRVGCVVIGATLCLGAVERVALPRREAGLLQVRSKVFDTVLLGGLGLGIIVLAVIVPEGRGRG